MDNFYVINNQIDFIKVNENFAGYIVFFKKSIDTKVADVQMNLLHKLIQNALKLELDNFLFIDLNTNKVHLTALNKLHNVNKCFLFGVDENEIGTNIAIPYYQLNKIAGIDFLKVDTPEKLEQNKSLKNKLWEQLQISFNLV